MARKYIGIDPGAKGFIAVLEDCAEPAFFPLLGRTPVEVAWFFGSLGDDIAVVIEEVHAVFGSSAKATFEFGRIYGTLIGIVSRSFVPLISAQPKEWQREVWINADKVWRYDGGGRRKVDTKATSINAARRLFPAVDLRRTPACRKADDNKADALLIAEYARRRNL